MLLESSSQAVGGRSPQTLLLFVESVYTFYQQKAFPSALAMIGDQVQGPNADLFPCNLFGYETLIFFLATCLATRSMRVMRGRVISRNQEPSLSQA